MSQLSCKSIRRKQTLIIMLTSGVALLLACSGFLIHELLTFRTQLTQNLTTLAQVIGCNSTTALDLSNARHVTNTLATLRAETHIVAACIYNKAGKVFASYSRDGRDLIFPNVGRDGQVFNNGYVDFFRDITIKGSSVGKIYIKSDLGVQSDRLVEYAKIVGALVLASLLAAIILSSQLDRLISGPIIHLANVAKAVARDKNYGVRAQKMSEDELGDLVDGFNQMLSQIQGRDFALQTARDTLELRVEQRTHELEQSLSVLHATLESTADGLLVVDLAGKTNSWNAKFVDMWNLSTDVLKDNWALFPAISRSLKDPDGFMTRVQQVCAQADAQSHDVVECNNGRVYEIYSLPQRVGGRSVGRVWSFRDVTQHRAAEEALRKSDERFQLVARATNDPVWDWDIMLDTLWWNQGFEKQFGYKTEELEPGLAGWTNRLHPEDRQQTLEAIYQVIESRENVWVGEYRFRRADGTYAYIYDRGYVMRDGRGTALRIVGAMVDITQRKRTEDELKQARDAAEAANRSKSQFLANMSHEIRTPMNAIIGMTNLTLETGLSSDQRHFLLTVKDSADTLLNVLNDILDFSKIEAGKMELQPLRFNLRERLEDTVSAFSLRAHEKKLELACFMEANVPEVVTGDPGRLRQILVNLLGNAVKFTERGEVVLRVFVEERKGDDVLLHFAVTDTGIGIAENKQQMIFEAFTQADNSATRIHGGTGLGLTISSQLSALMGGKIWVESKSGLGSTFHVTARFTVPASEARASEVPALRGLRVLVVDDNATNRHILQNQLERWGMLPFCAKDAHEALGQATAACAANAPFSLVILDAVMPGVDGWRVADQIRAITNLPVTSMMMLTSLGGRVSNSTVGICLTKPVRQSDLFDALMTAVGQSRPGVTQARPSASLRAARPLNILLAEDHPINQRLAVALVEKWGHTVSVAPNGRKAIEAWSTGKFDLVLMDVQMPEVNGMEATQAIRSQETERGRARIPIIAMTAHAIKGDREQCLAVGMDEYVSKPIDSRDLFAAIEKFAPATPVQAAVPLPVQAMIDSERLLDRVGGDRQLLREITALFFEDAERMVEIIGQSVQRGEHDELERAAHRLKGSMSNMELKAAAAIASRLEHAAHDHQLSEAYQMLRDITSQLEQARPALEALGRKEAA